MQHSRNDQRSGWRDGLLAGAAVAALGFGGAAMAQQQGTAPGNQQGQGAQAQPSQAPSQQPGSQLPVVVGQLRTAEQALRQAQGQIAGGQAPNVPQARTAVDAGFNVIGRVPEQVQQQDAWRTARRELDEARQALQGDQPDQQRLATQLREAADAVGALAVRMGGSADAGGAGAQQRAAGQPAQAQVDVRQQAPQVTVQQQEPRITVTQPPPQVTVRQPPPQVTIQQPEPCVTVQQAQPQVRVQQAEPQVTVQQQGQPQVTVQRQGEPQVTIQGQDGQRRDTAQATTDQRSGASSATPAPAQSGGSQPQQAAAPAAGGMALQSVQALMGTNVVGANGRDAGEVRNLLLDGHGRVRAAVVEWGGFLGIGTREALVPIDRIRLGQGNERAQLAMTREELEALPRYDRDRIGEYGRTQGWGEGLRLVR
jgi:hypothetical protein